MVPNIGTKHDNNTSSVRRGWRKKPFIEENSTQVLSSRRKGARFSFPDKIAQVYAYNAGGRRLSPLDTTPEPA